MHKLKTKRFVIFSLYQKSYFKFMTSHTAMHTFMSAFNLFVWKPIENRFRQIKIATIRTIHCTDHNLIQRDGVNPSKL